MTRFLRQAQDFFDVGIDIKQKVKYNNERIAQNWFKNLMYKLKKCLMITEEVGI